MIPQDLATDPCTLAPRWGISLQLAQKLQRVARRADASGIGSLVIISGYRSPQEQADLCASTDRPCAPVNRSTHTVCPATGADVWNANADQEGVKLALVAMAEAEGLRTGGGGPVAPNGLPVDWNHWDLGPRPTPS